MNNIVILIIVYILFKIGIIGKLINVSLPFLFGFVLAYIMYPLKKNKIIGILVFILLVILFFMIKIQMPLLIKEGVYLITILYDFIINVSIKYNINIKIPNLNYLNILNGISISVNYITNILITFISFIYFIYYFDSIKTFIKKYKIYNYLSYINKDLRCYIKSLIKISLISFFEYTFVFFIIGYPKYLLVGILSGILNMIPFFGGIITVLITILLKPNMIIRISITYLILGLIDGYIISPYIYGKYNKINPILTLMALSIGGVFGIKGIILAMPLLIILLSSIKYYKFIKRYKKI